MAMALYHWVTRSWHVQATWCLIFRGLNVQDDSCQKNGILIFTVVETSQLTDGVHGTVIFKIP